MVDPLGVTWRVPLVSTAPIPSMLTSVAFVVCQVSVADWPLSIVAGVADSVAVGAGGGGGGGGGGGATFLWHAPRNMTVPSMNTRVAHFFVECFTDSSSFLCARIVACNLWDSRQGALSASRKTVFHLKNTYFQLQLGCVFTPAEVNCFTLVPSASMLQIWSLPERCD